MSKDFTSGAKPEQLRQLFSIGLGESPLEQDTDRTASLDIFMEKPGSRIGRYKLLSVRGEGGMGVVYLAEQKHPIRRQVALKVIKPGMDSKRVIARFEAERQALALLDHPNIAHVHDAGTTENGRPYFVMEYVQGVPITEHCDRYKLTIAERLNLFLRVCEAVQHAHQKGIIHRDIKPSNVQVAIQGDLVVPKIIDFGVAKAISQPLTERTLVTEQGQFIGTPEYMSPEQAEMTGQDVDTRSDIYSLGVLLYELLTGILPFDSQTLRGGGIDRIRQMIREQEPKTPSTRLSTISGEDSTKLAKLRRTDIRTLGRLLHGDLDWITLKALEKDRMRRYQTAHALAEDIQRHLDSEPVLAGPPSSVYRLKKFIQKHRAQAIGTAVAAVLLAVILVISAMLIQAVDRNRKAKSLEHQSVLSKAMAYRSKGQYEEALAELGPILDSEHVGPRARLLRAQITLKLQGPDEAIGQLEELTGECDEIACQAHFLLARIYLETDPDDPNEVASYRLKGEEHQQKGEELFSESPEAYYNRALMAGTVDRTLEWLTKGLDRYPDHYDSLQARALAYHVLKKYDRMEGDARAMTVKEPSNPRGYAERAIARRERAIQEGDKELLREAISDHDRAIGLSLNDVELYEQRRQTYMQMGDYDAALLDARECVRLKPDENIYHFHAFCALVALGRIDQAQAEFDGVFYPNSKSRLEFENWSRKYVFDTLAAAQSWHPSESRPTGVAFLPMVEADEDYRRLDKRARRIVPEGANPTWSPDGTELVYSRGVTGFSGIEIVNVETGKTRLLTVPGWDPSWSPDGRYIAFVRYRQVLLLADLAAEHALKVPPHEQREVWIIKSDGTEGPRFLTKGHWPYWSRDSKRIFYHLPEAMKIYSISTDDGSQPTPIAWCPNFYPAVSPDGKYIAYALRSPSAFLRLVDVSSGSLVAGWGGPEGMLFVHWSPDGRQLSVTSSLLYNGYNIGLWIYNIEGGEASKVLSVGWIIRGRWSPDGRRMALALALPSQEIWVADMDSLGPGRTLREHHQDEVDRLTHHIETAPEYARYYLWRAREYICLGNGEEALRDLKKNADLGNDPARAARHYNDTAWGLVHARQEMANLEIAVELSRKAHEIQPKNWEYLCCLGAAHYRMGEWEQAITTLAESIELVDGENALNYLFLAMAYWQLGNKAEAKNFYNEAIEWIEANKDIWFSDYKYMVFEIYVEAAGLMGVEMNDLFTKGVLHKL